MEKTQIITRNKQSGKGSNGSHNNDASALLETLDKFALRAFNASLGEINRDNNISEYNLQHVCTISAQNVCDFFLSRNTYFVSNILCI